MIPKQNQIEPTKVELKATRVFYENMYSTERYVINRGGAGSSKSFSLAQHIFVNKFLGESNKWILILRKTLPSARLSVLSMMREFVSKTNTNVYIKENKSDLNMYYRKTKEILNFIHFGSIDDPEKMKSIDWNYIWMEEATEFTLKDFNTLKLRLRRPSEDGMPNQMFLSFNPVDAFHWIKSEVLDKQPERCKEIVSTYKNNPFLDEVYVEELEGLQKLNPNLHQVYALGQWGRAEHTIYSNYRVVADVPDSYDEHFYGLDFGSTNPCALVEVIIKDCEVFVYQRIYERLKTNKDLIEMMNSIEDLDMKAPFYCDSAEPRRIEELYNAGYNAHSSDKEVLDGIDFVQRIMLNIHKSSTDLVKEIGSYSWRVDRRGIVLEEPVKYNDHLLDALRYALYTHLQSRREYQFAFVGADVQKSTRSASRNIGRANTKQQQIVKPTAKQIETVLRKKGKTLDEQMKEAQEEQFKQQTRKYTAIM